MTDSDDVDRRIAFTVASVWRDERITCPHPDLLQSWLQGGVDGGAADFLAFHLKESQCPYCNAAVQDLQAREVAARQDLTDLRDKLMRSTVTELRRKRA